MSVACIDPPPEPEPPAARVVASWDPLAPAASRVVVELEDEDEDGARDFGIFHGRIYAWTAGEPIRSVTPVRLVVDVPVVHWQVATPP